MVLPLVGALLSFSKTAQGQISALSGIQQSVPNPQSVTHGNIVSAMTESITSVTGDMFSSVPGFLSDASSKFMSSITQPKALSTTLQNSTFSSLFGTGLTAGGSVDSFLSANARLEDVIPAQQLQNILKDLGTNSLYTDPLQAYAQVTTAARDLGNMCDEAVAIIADITNSASQLLSVQTQMDYAGIQSMNDQFFGTAGQKVNVVHSSLQVLQDTLGTRGRYDPAQLADFCTAVNDLSGFLLFSNTKAIEFFDLMGKIVAAVNRLIAMGEDIVKIANDVVGFVPAYVASVTFGKVLQFVQAKVLEKANIDILKVISDLETIVSSAADNRAKLLAIFDMVGGLQAVRALVCQVKPADTITNPPAGKFLDLKDGYATLNSTILTGDMENLFIQLGDHAPKLYAAMNTGSTKDNRVELSSQMVALGAILSPLAIVLSGALSGVDTFVNLFKNLTASNPTQAVGASQLYGASGLDAARNKVISKEFESTTEMNLPESTTMGQLAEAMAKRINEMPEGYEKTEMIKLHALVLARHRAIEMSLGLQRREEVIASGTPSQEEQNRKLVIKINKEFSGLSPGEFDVVNPYA